MNGNIICLILQIQNTDHLNEINVNINKLEGNQRDRLAFPDNKFFSHKNIIFFITYNMEIYVTHFQCYITCRHECNK